MTWNMLCLLNDTNQQSIHGSADWCIVPWTEALNAKIESCRDFLKSNPEIQSIAFNANNDGFIINLEMLNKKAFRLAENLYDTWQEKGFQVIELLPIEIKILTECTVDNVRLIVTHTDFYFIASYEDGLSWTEVESNIFDFPPVEGYKITQPV